MGELERFIDEVHNEPYNFLTNNCVHKHTRIVRKARELGHDASLIGCIGMKPAGLRLMGPHVYAEVDNQLIDVTMEPELEETLFKNEDRVRLFAINISKLRPMHPAEGPPLPRALPGWPRNSKQ